MSYTVQPVSNYRSKKRTIAAIIMVACFGLGLLLSILAVFSGTSQARLEKELEEAERQVELAEVERDNAMFGQVEIAEEKNNDTLSGQSGWLDLSKSYEERVAEMHRQYEDSVAEMHQQYEDNVAEMNQRSEDRWGKNREWIKKEGESGLLKVKLFGQAGQTAGLIIFAIIFFAAGAIGGGIMLTLAKRTEQAARLRDQQAAAAQMYRNGMGS